MLSVVYILAGVLFLIATFVILLVWLKRKSEQNAKIIQYTSQPPMAPFTHIQAITAQNFNYRSLKLADQPEEWKLGMKQVGQCFHNAGLERIYFIHGTFVGDDPYGLLTMLKRVYPSLSIKKELAVKKKIKQSIDWIHKDVGNFPKTYIDLFATATQTECRLFRWSSANHHSARLSAALELINRLASDLTTSKHHRLLLIGHSHAGQVFALLSLILGGDKIGNQLVELLKEERLYPKKLRRNLAKLRGCRFDFVTLGAPIRYPWSQSKQYQLIHLINHPASGYLAPNPLNLLSSDYGGDFVQQWGVIGSDYLAFSKKDRRLNRRLDRILGPGIEPHGWLKAVKNGMLVSPFGKTYLVDYQTGHPLIPDGISSLFGHGVYTKFAYMRFTAELICKQLYQSC